ncbi:MAG: hypothetical protein JO257_14580 [Deltaproteobacteria bacterium]|nr:hypothetical protein [Deltaproteobacteria bacterium]
MRTLLLLAVTACIGSMPPPPKLHVTSPKRSMVQSTTGQVVVEGTAVPGIDGALVTGVTVNGTAAHLAADGSFSATVDVPAGAMLLETVATTDQGGTATDARAVQVGELRPVGTSIDRAVTAALSADAFAKLSAAAGPLIMSMNLPQLLAQTHLAYGDNIAHLALTISNLALGDVKVSMKPVAGGLQFSAELDAIDVTANAVYGGDLVPEGTTAIRVTASQVTIAGTLVITPNGTAGFTTKIATPAVHTNGLHVKADGLTGQILDLLDSNLDSTIQSIATSTAETSLEPLINAALGALAGPQRLTILGKTLDLEASPAAVTFSPAGGLVTMNLAAKIEGSESSPGYIYSPNGTPAITMTSGVQLGLADDFVNEMLAEVHALGLLDIKLDQSFGPFDGAEIKLTIPPMVSGNTPDGSMRLILGDMVATLDQNGAPALSAAINAQVDLSILPGANPQDIALKLGKTHLFVNLLDPNADDASAGDVYGAASNGIELQLDSLSQFLVTVPVPSVAGVSFDALSLHGDSGYVVVSGQIH